MHLSVPNLTRIVETFVLIGPQEQVGPQMWAGYLDLLRFHVSPLIADLRSKGLVGWFSFLVHNRIAGADAQEDRNLYVHLRFELVGSATFEQLRDALPPFCQFTTPHGPIDEKTIAPAHAPSLNEPSVARGWALFGASSEWTLELVCSHRADMPIPLQNVAQFLHYLGNQLMVGATPIQMP